jgi:hypothetical protein
LRIVTRRIELHQASDNRVFGQIKELQRDVRVMKRDQDKLNQLEMTRKERRNSR